MSNKWLSLYNTENFVFGNTPDGSAFVADKLSSMNSIADKLIPSADDADTLRELSSIPDIWEDPRIAQMLLTSVQNEKFFLKLRDEVVEEQWRAIIAALVLSKSTLQNGYFALEDSPYDALPNAPYSKVVLDLKPKSSIWETTVIEGDAPVNKPYNWNYTKWIYVRNKSDYADKNKARPFAVFSPTTIVAPAAQFYKNLEQVLGEEIKAYPWFTAAGVKDPTDSLPLRKAVTLYSWLVCYREYLEQQTLGANKQSAKDNIIALVSRFEDNLKARFGQDGNGNPKLQTNGAQYNFASPSDLLCQPEWNTPQIKVYIRRPTAGDNDIIFVDDLQLKDKKEMNGVSIDSIQAFNEYTLDRFIRDESLDSDPNITAQHDVMRTSKFFLDELHYVSYSGVKNILRDTSTASAADGVIYTSTQTDKIYLIFWPFANASFNMLRKIPGFSCSVSVDDAEATNPKFDIKVSIPINFNGNGLTYEIKKRYELGELTELTAETMCVAGVWPRLNLDNAGWKQYHFFSQSGVVNNEFSIRPSGAQAPKRYDDMSGSVVEYYTLAKFPEYAELVKKDGAGTSVVGYVSIRSFTPNPLAQTVGATYQVGVDFGTSSTTVYCDAGGGVLAPLGGEHLSMGAICNYDVEGDTDNESETRFYAAWNFVTAREFDSPFQTLLRLHHAQNAVAANNFYSDFHIYFKKLILPTQEEKGHERVESGFKWAIGQNAVHVQKFLQHLSAIVLLDASARKCGSVVATFTYPASLSSVDDYKNTASNSFIAAESLYIDDAVTTRAQVNRQPNYMTESEAAARFFKNLYGGINRMCVIDIGGGSSDLFYWELANAPADGLPYYRAIDSSLKLGAQDIVVGALYRNAKNIINSNKNHKDTQIYRLLSEAKLLRDDGIANPDAIITGDQVRKIVDQARKVSRNDFNADWESQLLRKTQNGDTVGNQLLKTITGPTFVIGKSDAMMLTAIAFNIAAIMYAAGMLMRNGKGAAKAQLDVQFSGNGSNMVKWLGSSMAITAFVREILVRSSGTALSGNINVGFSPKLKHEAAEGMLCGPIQFGGAVLNPVQFTAAGESYVGPKARDIDEHELWYKTVIVPGHTLVVQQSLDNYPASATNSSMSAFDRSTLFALGDVQTGISPNTIGRTEFDGLLNAYNAAVMNLNATKNTANRIVLTNAVANPLAGEVRLSETKWESNRTALISNALQSPNDNPGSKSFFLLEVEALRELLYAEL
ncbi:MAG: hypothetical protein LBN30_04975 [Oscillospiraceae bacterium]|jgi:hypothetical protein|nr:hypothetical protein [Oscillospiraceae bacterium]